MALKKQSADLKGYVEIIKSGQLDKTTLEPARESTAFELAGRLNAVLANIVESAGRIDGKLNGRGDGAKDGNPTPPAMCLMSMLHDCLSCATHARDVLVRVDQGIGDSE